MLARIQIIPALTNPSATEAERTTLISIRVSIPLKPLYNSSVSNLVFLFKRIFTVPVTGFNEMFAYQDIDQNRIHFKLASFVA
ncbi:MAG: hypothetical protein COY19_06060 [Candidatus Marinimicrobia bacterium CG_4_10_14_0_2_um_filter_48_9]|nr:MAG: hypothetical protein COY19_06060 [Candidatus Marinimicrobia bacterium CG_4_10_14_0_2_um_filter_48_9]